MSIDMKGDLLVILVVNATSNGCANLHQGIQVNCMSTQKIRRDYTTRRVLNPYRCPVSSVATSGVSGLNIESFERPRRPWLLSLRTPPLKPGELLAETILVGISDPPVQHVTGSHNWPDGWPKSSVTLSAGRSLVASSPTPSKTSNDARSWTNFSSSSWDWLLK